MKKTAVLIAGLILCLIAVFVTQTQAQSFDQKRMDRDLKVAENILRSLIESDKKWGFSSSGISSSFVESYGVIFTVNRGGAIIRGYSQTTSEAPVVIGSQSNVTIAGTPPPPPPPSKEDEVEADVIVEMYTGNKEGTSDLDNWKTFLVDYGDLIGQLTPDHKIMIRHSNSGNNFFIYSGSGINVRNRPSFEMNSAEIEVSKIKSYKEGKISRDKALESVEVKKIETVEVEKDLSVFPDIIYSVYNQELSDTYFTSGKPNIERIKDMGVIYHMSFYSSNPSSLSGERVHYMPTLKLENLSQADRDNKVKELFPKFVEDFKTSIIEYGRTIRSLDDKESVIIKAKMTTCDGCGIPDSVEFTVKADVLKKVSSGKLSIANAVKQVEVNEVGKQ